MSSQAISVTDDSTTDETDDGEPSDEELFDDLYRLQRESEDGTYPGGRAVVRDGRYSVGKYRKRWGTVAKARVAAKMHEDPREAIVEYLRERAGKSGRVYIDSKTIAGATGFEAQTVGGVVSNLEDEDSEETGVALSRRSTGGTGGRVLWVVTEA